MFIADTFPDALRKKSHRHCKKYHDELQKVFPEIFLFYLRVMMYFHIFSSLVWDGGHRVVKSICLIVYMFFVCFVFHLIILTILSRLSVNITISSIVG